MTTRLALQMLAAMAAAVAISFLSTPLVKTLAYKVGAIDVPKDSRRMHKVPIPRLGGLAIFLAFLLSALIFADIDRQLQGILLGAVIIVVLGALGGALVMRYFGDSISGAALVPHAERMPSAAISTAAARRFVLLLMGCSP